MEDRVINAALAGLLHDVGKLEQRARVDPWKPPEGLADTGQPVHAAWSIYFIQNCVPKEYQAAALAGGYHHAPEESPAQDKRLSQVVELADKLSAGERADQTHQYAGKRPPQQQVTIFDRVSLKNAPQAKSYLPLSPLELKESVIFPGAAQTPEAQAAGYEKLRFELEQAARQSSPSAETYLENMLAAMQRITWCVPSAYYHAVPDVSLYDHCRMTAALAVCLSGFAEEQVNEMLGAVRRDFYKKPQSADASILSRPVALLLGGDISGVQDFIYTLSSKGAAKTLRGRSFFLQLLTEAVLRYVLRELGLPYTNVIYSGGGHFYLLAPASAAQRLTSIRQYITTTLLLHHGSALYVALDGIGVPASGFGLGQFTEYWSQMHGRLSRVKQRRYAELGEDLYDRVFKPEAQGGNHEATCAVCGEEVRPVSPLGEPDDAAAKICALCQSFAGDIGARLPEARFVALGLQAPVSTQRGGAFEVLRAFGLSVQFAQGAADRLTWADKPERIVVWALDDTDRWPGGGVPTAHLTRYTVNQVPPMTFDKLQEEAQGIPRLGVLRMDVDNLGDLFKDGFGSGPQGRASLARISTLSFQLSLFFEGWVKRLCELYPDLIYAVYAGGDDVFLIGPWDKMPPLAQAINSDLSRYTGGNADFHLSGGMTFIHGKYPVYQAAEDAKDELEAAKALPGKNAFSFLGQAWKWQDFDQVSAKCERLLKLVGKGRDEEDEGLGGPQAILQVLRQLAQDEADAAKRLNGRPVWGPWMWHGAYQFTRMADREKRRDAILAQELLAIRDELSKNNYSEIGQWGTAARWAQLRLRKTTEDRSSR